MPSNPSWYRPQTNQIKTVTFADLNTIKITFAKALSPLSFLNLDYLYANQGNINIYNAIAVNNVLLLTLDPVAAAALRRKGSKLTIEYLAPLNPRGTTATSTSLDSFSQSVATKNSLKCSASYLSRNLLLTNSTPSKSSLASICAHNISFHTPNSKATLTLKLDAGIFVTSLANAKISNNKRTLAITGTQEDLASALSNIRVRTDASVAKRLKNGSTLAAQLSCQLTSGSSTLKDTLKIYAENIKSSFFAVSKNTYAYINGLVGLTQKNFTTTSGKNRYYYRSQAVIDADKSYVNTSDDNLCWAATAANMLTYTGYAQAGLNLKTTNTLEDRVFQEFTKNFSNEGSYITYGLQWFLTGDYAAHFDCAIPKANSGNYLAKAAFATHSNDIYYVHDARDSLSDLADRVFAGNVVGLAIDNNVSAHAVTCFGLSFDASKARDNPKWLTGFYITDSDDSTYKKKDIQNAPDVLRHIKVTWNATNKTYKLVNYNGNYIWDGNFVSLAPKSSLQEQTAQKIVGQTTGTANITSLSLAQDNTWFKVKGTANSQAGLMLEGNAACNLEETSHANAIEVIQKAAAQNITQDISKSFGSDLVFKDVKQQSLGVQSASHAPINLQNCANNSNLIYQDTINFMNLNAPTLVATNKAHPLSLPQANLSG
ncbi:MAG: hypothetical protein IJU79_01895 [Desulfovibrionaceae bacterium]|nr:hypothetical protein [Desulfovibrionaceae bacterium]